MKKQFEIKNFLDQRYRSNKDFQRWFNKYTLAALVDGIILGALVGLFIADNPYKEVKLDSPNALQTTLEVKAVEVTPVKVACDYDAITYIRCRGEQLGMSNQDITKMIRIARAESNFNQYAKNPNSTAKGIYQFIDSTWRSNCLKDGNVYDFKDNIDCAWKVYQKQGDRPWNASKHIWNK